MIQWLTAAHYKKMRWKNGAGFTLELARSDGDHLHAFDWRISMADVNTSGEFSRFGAMQRILTVLQGKGLLLQIDDNVKQLNPLQSVQFSGDSLTRCRLLDGQIRDFNLIYDPKKYYARLQWMLESLESQMLSSADLIFIFNQSTEVLEIEIDRQKFHLEHQESVKIENEQLLKSIVLRSPQWMKACLIELTKI